jgi:hypothetical protein
MYRHDRDPYREFQRYRRFAQVTGLLIGVALGFAARTLPFSLFSDTEYDKCLIANDGKVFAADAGTGIPVGRPLRPEAPCRSIAVLRDREAVTSSGPS